MTALLFLAIEEISSLTLWEWVTLKATLISIEQPKFQCNACLQTYRGRQDQDAMTTKLQKEKGCLDGLSLPVFAFEDSAGRSARFTRCPGNFVSQAHYHWIETHSHFKRGVLPFPGSLQDQPNKVIEVFRTIDAHNDEITKRRAEEEKRKAFSKQLARGKRG